MSQLELLKKGQNNIEIEIEIGMNHEMVVVRVLVVVVVVEGDGEGGGGRGELQEEDTAIADFCMINEGGEMCLCAHVCRVFVFLDFFVCVRVRVCCVYT